MNVKLWLYIIVIPFSMWIVQAFYIERFFKKNYTKQIIAFYIVISLSLTYLIVNFIYDFYNMSRIIT